jgi:hypothetical protein
MACFLSINSAKSATYNTQESDPGQSLGEHHEPDGQLTILQSHDEHIASDQINTNETNQAQLLRSQNFHAGVVRKHRRQPPIYEKALKNQHGQQQRVCPIEHAGRQSQLSDPIEIQIKTVAADQLMSSSPVAGEQQGARAI